MNNIKILGLAPIAADILGIWCGPVHTSGAYRRLDQLKEEGINFYLQLQLNAKAVESPRRQNSEDGNFQEIRESSSSSSHPPF